MAKPRSNKNNKNKRTNSPKPSGAYRKNGERNNAQDEAMDREYNKGRRSVHPVEIEGNFNDPDWYTPSNIMLENVASFPYGISSGNGISTHTVPYPSNDEGIIWHEIPGVMCFNVAPTVGASLTKISPINVAASAEFTALQSGNSRTPSYEASDMMMYQVALSDVYSFYVWMTRIYGVMNRYELLNRYTPQTLIEAMNVNFLNVQQNMANFRAYINQYAYFISSFYLPKDLAYCKRKIFMYDGIYMDSTSTKSQFYLFNPVGFYMWVEGDPTHPITKLDLQKLGNNMTVAQIISYGNNLLEPLRTSEDIRMISADMLKLFGAQNTFPVHPIDDTYTVIPSMSEEIGMQIENMVILPRLKATGPINFSITQNTEINGGQIETSLKYTPDDFNLYGDLQQNVQRFVERELVVNMHKDSPSAADTMVATRLSTIPRMDVDVTNPGHPQIEIKNCFSEVILGATIWTFAEDTGNAYENEFCTTIFVDESDPVNRLLGQLTMMSHIANFDWHPRVRLALTELTSSSTLPIASYNWTDYYWDLDNFTVITEEEQERLNEIAMIGLFEVKLKGTLQFAK